MQIVVSNRVAVTIAGHTHGGQVAPFGSLDLPRLQTDQAWREYTTRHLRLGQPTAFAALPYLNDPRNLPFSAAPKPHLYSAPPYIPLAA
jgi:hypothetical protein